MARSQICKCRVICWGSKLNICTDLGEMWATCDLICTTVKTSYKIFPVWFDSQRYELGPGPICSHLLCVKVNLSQQNLICATSANHVNADLIIFCWHCWFYLWTPSTNTWKVSFKVVGHWCTCVESCFTQMRLVISYVSGQTHLQPEALINQTMVRTDFSKQACFRL